jgi:uncharacterized protein (UPF0210 family)
MTADPVQAFGMNLYVIPIARNNDLFERVKASEIDNRKLSRIAIICRNLYRTWLKR